MPGKSLPNHSNVYARKFVKRIVDEEFEGNVFRASEAFGISQSFLYEFLNERRGAGMKLVRGVAGFKRISVDEVIGNKIMLQPREADALRILFARFTNREAAIQILVEGGESELMVRESADAVAAANRAGADPPKWQWLKAIEAVLELKKSSMALAAGAEAETVRVPVQSDSGHPEAEPELLSRRKLGITRVNPVKRPKRPIDQRSRAVDHKKRVK